MITVINVKLYNITIIVEQVSIRPVGLVLMQSLPV